MNSKKIFICLAILTLNLLISVNTNFIDSIFHFKRCPERPQLYTDLNVEQFLGRWYSQLAIPNLFERGKCGSTNYFYDDKNVTLYNQDRELNGAIWVYSPTNSVTHDTPGVLSLHMWFITSDLNILETDHTNYAIVYSCRSLYITEPFKLAWVLTRRPVISEEERAFYYQRAEALFQKIDVKMSDLETIVQDCEGN
jgi:lipocalin